MPVDKHTFSNDPEREDVVVHKEGLSPFEVQARQEAEQDEESDEA